MPGSLLIVNITLHFLLVMLGFSIITVCSLFSAPWGSPSLLSPQPRSAQQSFVAAEAQNEPAKFTQRFAACRTLAHVYANSHLHTPNACCCLQTWFILACCGCTCKFPSSSINYLLPHNRYVPFPETIHFRLYITLLSCKSINTAMSPYRNVFAQFFLWFLLSLCWSLFSFLNLQLPLLLPRPCFCSLLEEKEQQLCLFLTWHRGTYCSLC